MRKPPTPDMLRWTLAWSNPYTSSPDGGPRILVEQVLPRGVKPEEAYRLFVPDYFGID